MFAGVASFLSNAPRNVSIRVLPSFQTQWNRMAVQIQAIAFDSQQLSQNIQDQTNQAILINTILTVALLSIFVAFFIMIYFVAYQRTARSIIKLKNGIGVIGSGNLDYTIEAGKKDEVADISKSVNQMAADLKTVTASKTDLEQAQVSLRESEQRWATTLASIGDAVIATDTSGKIAFMNGEAEKLTGWLLSETLSKPVKIVFKIVNEQSRLEVESPIERVLREGMVIGLANHTVLIRKDGSEVPIDDSGAPIKDKEGKTTGVVLIFRDIIERKKAEEALNRSKRLLESVFSSMNEGVVILDRAGNIVDFNEGFAHICRFKNKEETLRSINQFAMLFRTYRLDGSPMPVNEWAASRALAGETGYIENIAERTDTGERFILSSSYAPLKDEQGQIIGGVQASTDITERKKVEEALRESRAKLQIAFASMTEAIFIADAEGNIVDFNDEFVRYHRFKNRDECSRNIADCPKYLDVWLADGTPAPVDQWAMARALRGEIGSNVEYRLRRRETGETWWGSYNFSPIKDQLGKIVGAVVAGRDITERKKAEEALSRLNEELEERVQKRTQEVSSERQRLYKVLETLPAYVVLLDKDYRMPFANKVFRETFGESHGRRCHEYLFGRDSECENCDDV